MAMKTAGTPQPIRWNHLIMEFSDRKATTSTFLFKSSIDSGELLIYGSLEEEGLFLIQIYFYCSGDFYLFYVNTNRPIQAKVLFNMQNASLILRGISGYKSFSLIII